MQNRQWPIFLILSWVVILSSGKFLCVAQEIGQNEQTDELIPLDKEPDAFFVPTPQHIVDLMLELGQIEETDLVYDLGCGDGRFLVSAAKKFGCKAVGVDIDPKLVLKSRANAKEAGVEDLVTIEQKDIFEVDLSEVNVLMLYLLPELNAKLVPQMKKMKPGSRIVCYEYPIPGIEPHEEVTVTSRFHGDHKIYSWTLPFNRPAPAPEEPNIIDTVTGTSRTGPLGEGLPGYVYTIPFAVAFSAAIIATLFWLMRKRMGVIKISVSRDRIQNQDEQDTTPANEP